MSLKTIKCPVFTLQMKNHLCKRLATCLCMKTSPFASREPALICVRHRNGGDGEQCRNIRIVYDDTKSFNQTTENDSAKKLLHEIRDLLKTKVHSEEEQSHEADKEDELKKDWMLAAAVLDRICAIAFSIVFIGISLVFIILFITHP